MIGANVAALNFAVLSFHTLRLNRALLPEALRAPLWREIGGGGWEGSGSRRWPSSRRRPGSGCSPPPGR